MTSTMTPLTSPLMRGEKEGGLAPHEGEKRDRKILVIGSKGMLGQELVRVFSRDHEVVAWDREEINIMDFRATSYKLQATKPDLLINAAAYTDVDGAEANSELANSINGYAVRNLAKACKELGISMVHFSTEYVFDGEKKEGYCEDDTPNPISAYGASKYLGEQELVKNTEKFYLIRLSRLFGKATSPGLRPPSPGLGRGRGEVEPMRKRSFVEIMLDLAKTKTEIDVVDEELSSPTYAPDLAEATKSIVESGKPFGIYHRSNAGACTWYAFAAEIFKIAGISVKLNPVPGSHFSRAAKRPQYAVLFNTKLEPMRTWQEALTEFLNSKS